MQAVATRSTYPLADRALGGKLEQRLRDARARGKSYEDITVDLSADGIRVSTSTVHRWCRELDIPTRERQAS